MGDWVEYTFGTDPTMVDSEIPTTQKKKYNNKISQSMYIQ